MTITAETYAKLADYSYSTNAEDIQRALNNKMPGWEVLKVNEGKITSNVNGFQGVAYGHKIGVDANGVDIYDNIVIACTGSQPLPSLNISQVIKDWFWADVVQIGSGSNLTQYDSAQKFYNNVVAQYGVKDQKGNSTGSNISITGHSMGGSLAQLLCAQYGNYGVTFNAPGTAFQANNMHWTGTNVDNYVIMNDIIGNIRDHVGTEYYLDPTETNSHIYSPHGAYTQVTYFSDNHTIGWTFEKALALFWFDINNNPTIQTAAEAILQLNERVMDLTGRGLIDGYSTLSFESLNNYLKDHVIKSAVETVRDLGTPDLILQYSVTRVGDYIIGDATGGKK